MNLQLLLDGKGVSEPLRQAVLIMQSQIAELTKERDTYCEKWHAELAKRDATGDLIAANTKLRGALAYCLSQIVEFEDVPGVAAALALPDISTPVMNRIKAEGMRMAAEICDSVENKSDALNDSIEDSEGKLSEYVIGKAVAASSIAKVIRTHADELEKTCSTFA